MENGEEFLKQGQQLREQGKTFEALDMLNKAMQAFVQEKNYARFAHVLLDRAICWQHLYQFNGNSLVFAVLYKKDAEAMLEVLETNQVKAELDGAYFINAKALSLFGNYSQAAELFQKALQLLPSSKNAQRGDWQTNLGKALYYSGNKEKGEAEILAGIEQIKNYLDEVDDYTGKVWLSGGFLRLAEVLKTSDSGKSEEYFKLAKDLLGSDARFTVRQKQLENFKASGKSGL